MNKLFGFLSNEIFLGTLIALLSIFTAVASYQGAMADSEQNKYEILGMQALNDGNAEYLSANQTWIACPAATSAASFTPSDSVGWAWIVASISSRVWRFVSRWTVLLPEPRNPSATRCPSPYRPAMRTSMEASKRPPAAGTGFPDFTRVAK